MHAYVAYAHNSCAHVVCAQEYGVPETNRMHGYLWSGCKAFSGEQQISMTFDMSFCSREATLAVGIYSTHIKKCMWLPPQATRQEQPAKNPEKPSPFPARVNFGDRRKDSKRTPKGLQSAPKVAERIPKGLRSAHFGERRNRTLPFLGFVFSG